MKPRLLFIKNKEFNARTVVNDIDILSEKYQVKLYNSKIGKGLVSFFGFAADFFYLMFNIFRFKVVFIWFADYHSYLPCSFAKLFGKKCILCLGGYDAHWIVPDKTNTLKEKFRKFCVLKSIKYASVILPVSNWLAGFVKHLKSEDQIRVAYCCVNPRYLNDEKNPLKENWVLTVGGGGFLYETKRKKLDFFIEVGNYFSKSFPEYNAKFVLIGHNKDEITYNYLINFIKSPNVTILPPINDTAVLKEYFSKAKIYCQFSEYESFGIAVIEAMLNKTIPVVYNGGAMPEVVGDTGIVINDYDIKKTALIIKDIFDGKHDGLKAKTKQRVIDNFTTSSRKEIIFQYI